MAQVSDPGPRKTNHDRSVEVITSARTNLENLLPLIDPGHPHFMGKESSCRRLRP